MSSLIETISPYVGAIPVFLYLIYLVGRTFIETYLSQLGIPRIIEFSTSQCIFYGTQIGNLLITFVFTTIFIGFIRYLRYRPTTMNLISENKLLEKQINKKGPKWLVKIDIFMNLQFLPYSSYSIFVYGAFLFLIYSVLFLYINQAPYQPTIIVAAIIPLIIFASFSISFLLFNVSFISWLKPRKKMSTVFTIVLIIQLIFFPSISAKAWGAMKGYVDNNNLKIIQITSAKPLINEIKWENNSEGIFTSSDNLSLGTVPFELT